MSSPAPLVRRPSLWREPEALRRARLKVVPPAEAASARRLPFVALVTVLLVGGVVGILMFNTSMQQAAFSQSELQEQATNLAAREQTMQMRLERMQDPQQVAKKAQALGLVIPGRPAIMHLPSGKIEGKPEPAGRGATPPLYPRNPAPVPPKVKKQAELAEQQTQQQASQAEQQTQQQARQQASQAEQQAQQPTRTPVQQPAQ